MISWCIVKMNQIDNFSLDPTRQLIYGLAESVGVLVQSILEERGVLQQMQPMLQPKYDQVQQDAPFLTTWKEEPQVLYYSIEL